jgi:phosphoribosylamine--glycine ligase
MRVLLVGSGGREHALAWKIAQSPLLTKLWIAPGNPGTANLGENCAIAATAVDELVAFARQQQIDLVVVGPEAALAAGLTDACQAVGINVFGPTQAAARLESSKAFAKQLMNQSGVPTAEAHTFTAAAEALSFAQTSNRPWVVKADGLASGKGVIVADTLADTLLAIQQLGATEAGQTLVLEERLVGREVSLIALCDGERLLVLPAAQDHKRLYDGDTGPNTGGMGAFAPSPYIDNVLIGQIVTQAMLPIVAALAARGTPFCGALYAGLMLTEQGPKVLEFNARFGDPETQAIMPLITGDLLAALLACATGTLEPTQLSSAPAATACVVLAAEGYPEQPRSGDPISGLDTLADPHVLLFQAGTALNAQGELCTAGGRVLGITGRGADLRTALDRAYAAIQEIQFAGMHYRRDIGVNV